MAARRPDPAAADTRQRLFDAAAAEFASRGFDGANVDRIARAARVNKAMIYYHFKSKAALYRAILHDMFDAVALRVREAAAQPGEAADKIRGFVEAIALEAEARPYFPPIWLREVADGGRHLDESTFRRMTGVVTTLGGVVQEGVAAGRFKPVHPILVHAGVVAPLLLYFATTKIRARVEQAGLKGAGTIRRDDVVAGIQRVAVALLEGRTA
jgi:AcrR family transcriptional regulator